MIAGVVRRHNRVTGRTSEGPVLLDWVQTTAGFGFMEAYHAYVRPLTTKERDELCTEALPAAQLYGATGAPSSQEDLDASVKAMGRRLAASPIVFEFWRLWGRFRSCRPQRAFQRMLLKAAVEILPGWVRPIGVRLQLVAHADGAAIHARLARVSDRLILRLSPAVQSCRRLGLADPIFTVNNSRRSRPPIYAEAARAVFVRVPSRRLMPRPLMIVMAKARNEGDANGQ